MAKDLAKFAADNGVRFFLFNFTDLFGIQRAKLVPAEAAGDMQKSGAGFAGFAAWLDMTPAHPDMAVMPDADSVNSAVSQPGPKPSQSSSSRGDLTLSRTVVDGV